MSRDVHHGNEMSFEQRSSLIRQRSDEILTLVSGDGNGDTDYVSCQDDSGYDPAADSSFSNGGGRESDELDRHFNQGQRKSNSSSVTAATADAASRKSNAETTTPTTPTPRGAETTIGALSARSPAAHTSLKKFYNTSTLPLTDDEEDDEEDDDGCHNEEFNIEDIPKVRYSSISRMTPSNDNYEDDMEDDINANSVEEERSNHINKNNVTMLAKEHARQESMASRVSPMQSSESTYPSQNLKEETYPSQNAESLYPSQNSKPVPTVTTTYQSQDGKHLASTNEGTSTNTSQHFPQKQQLSCASSPIRPSEEERMCRNEAFKDKSPDRDYPSVDNDTTSARTDNDSSGSASKSRNHRQGKQQSGSQKGEGQPQRRREDHDSMLEQPLGDGLEDPTSTVVLATTAAPDLNRGSRYTPSPGAQRVRGICAAGDEDLDDFDFENDFDYQNNDNKGGEGSITRNDDGHSDPSSPPPTGRPSPAVSLANADNPIEAMLVDVDAQHAMEAERERKLREREAAIKAKEMELEEQMASLRAAQEQVAGNVIQATAVDHSTKSGKKKKKGIKKIFNVFSRSSKDSNAPEHTYAVKTTAATALSPTQLPIATVSAALSPAPTYPGSPAAIALLPVLLQRQTSENVPLPSSLSRTASGSTGSTGRSYSTSGLVRHSSEGTVMSAAQIRHDPHRLPNLRIPLVSMNELHTGKTIKSGKFNTAYWVQSIELEDAAGKQLIKDVSQTLLNSNNRSNLIDNMPRIQEEVRDALSRQINQDFGNKGSSGWKKGGKNKQTANYVIKKLNSDDHKMLDPRLRTRAAAQLCHEATLLSHFDHDHVISLAGMTSGFSVTAPDENFFCILEYIPETLDMHLTKRWKRGVRGPQQFAERVKAAVQLASAVDYLHSINVMFSDLKPENVGFVTAPSPSSPNGEQCLKLFNFGGAKSLMGRAQVASYDLVASTTSPFVGSHPYVAPEVVYQRPSGLAIDTYAFAIILWEIMTLKEPFAGLMIHEYKDKVVRGNKRPKLEKTPKELHHIMTSCWDAHAMKRPCMKDVHLHLVRFQLEVVTAEMKKGGFR